MNFRLGQTARFRATFRTEAGALADPTTVCFKLKLVASPTPETTHVLGSDSAVFRESLGVFVFDFPVTADVAPGQWLVRAVGTGAVADATEQSFHIVASSFATS